MATKKQKRERAQAAREAFLADERDRGLEAQRISKRIRMEERETISAQATKINEHYNAILRNATSQDVAAAMRTVNASAISAAQHENLMANGPSRSQVDKLAEALHVGHADVYEEALDISKGE